MFTGEINRLKCDENRAKLREEGDFDFADSMQCGSMLFFRTDDFRLWSISMYYIIVTLSTCAPLALFSCCSD